VGPAWLTGIRRRAIRQLSDHRRDRQRRSEPWLLLVSLLATLIVPLVLFYAAVVGALIFNGFIGGQPP
jgi:hypothetical protein